MFCKGEYVVYGACGVCQIGEITTVDIANIPKDKEYYVLYPKYNEGKIFTSTDEKYMHLAEELLYSELEIALDVPKEQVSDYILKEVEKNNTETFE